MAPYETRIALYRDAHNFDEIIALHLQPLGMEYRVPLLTQQSDARSVVDQKIDIARRMTREVRNKVAQHFYKEIFKKQAPEDFDWDRFDRDELGLAIQENQELRQRVEHKDTVIRRYRMFMEALGKSWEVIEKAKV